MGAMKSRFLALLLCLSPGIAWCAGTGVPPELPLDVFFENAEISQLKISPNGRYLASLRPFNKRMQLVVVDLTTNKSKRLTDMKDENIASFSWLKDERLMFSQQVKGQESFGSYAVNADGSNLTIIRQATSVDANEQVEVQGGREQIVDTMPNNPDEIIIGLVRGRSGLSDLYRANVHKENRRQLICENPGKVREWITDSKGVPRIGVSQDERSKSSTILYRSNEKAEWKELATFEQDAPNWSPVGFDNDDRTLYVSSNIGRATYALYAYDPETKTMEREVCADPVYDVGNDPYGFSGGLIRRRADQKVIGITYLAEQPKTVWLDPFYEKLQGVIDKVLPGTRNAVTSATKDWSVLILSASSSRDPGTYYLLDVAKMELRELLRINSKVDPKQMAEMKAVTYKARDGMDIHAFLTLPAGVEAKNLPLIVHPHGGPYGPRDSISFNPSVQFLANRGYAVLQPNFRGSGGYGEAYERAGYKQWGLAMQDDLTDGAQWLIKEGIVNPKKVGIYGASYGGYAAMMGIIKEPQLFRCAVNYVGVTAIKILFEGFEDLPDAAKASLERRFGHPVKDAKYMNDNSPIYLVNRIQAPVLMAYGFFDPRVKLEHGELLYKEMKSQGKDVDYIVSKNEGHGFGRVENRMGFYRVMDDFFKVNLLGLPKTDVKVGDTKVLELPAK
jgi:dipeptidyl aminopeptidase/acylaminoacyl peptidase